MASNNTIATVIPKELHGKTTTRDRQTLKKTVKILKQKIEKDRKESIQDKLQRNKNNLCHQLSEVRIVSKNYSLRTEEITAQMLPTRIDHPLFKFSGFPRGLGKKDFITNLDISLENFNELENTMQFPYIARLPRYKFWVHLARNERMAKDQSFSRRRNIYYDKHGGETLICSDSEEELNEMKEVKREFSEGEDTIIWTAFEEHNFTKEVTSVVRKCIGGTNSEIQERYKVLKEKEKNQHSRESGEGARTSICLNESLSTALNIFDDLFCRRCMIYDCPLHGCSQPLIYSSEKPPIWFELEGDKQPCGDHCYRQLKDVNLSSQNSTMAPVSFQDKEIKEDANGDCSREQKEVIDKNELMILSNSMEEQVDEMEMDSVTDWKPLEKELYLKGIEMFGKNSCLIARNLLAGFKTCMQVATYMSIEGRAQGSMDPNGEFDAMCTDKKMPSRSFKRKGKKKYKYFTKTLGSSNAGDGGKELLKHYIPCECQGMCVKGTCSCLLKGTCCEKYCGCTQQCRNRFRGCHCFKSQCRTGQCPCFVQNRECDPDVCKNCWASCGDGSLEEPSHHGESQCDNMSLLLGKKQRILLARSDIAGWGAFTKNPINKNDCIGEYTGEILSHKEAESRGKLYEHIDFTYLFDLDDQQCLDSYSKGNKLKFANHSFKPNCYTKGMVVCGEHRIGIYAKERIEAGEELCYDYGYNPEIHRTPKWFKELLPKNDSKKKESKDSSRKAKKLKR